MSIIVIGDAGYIGPNIRDFIQVSDLVESHALALVYLQGDKPSKVFNFCNVHGFMVQEVIGTARQVMGCETLGWKPKLTALETVAEHAWAREQKWSWK